VRPGIRETKPGSARRCDHDRALVFITTSVLEILCVERGLALTTDEKLCLRPFPCAVTGRLLVKSWGRKVSKNGSSKRACLKHRSPLRSLR